MKVRYHLQKGPHYMHWQFKTATGECFYHKPSDFIIKLYKCILHNNRKVADKIYLGDNKDVCAWIKFQGFTIDFDNKHVPSWCTHIRYNPKVLPYWHNINSENLDGRAFDELYLTDKGVFFDSCRDGVSLCKQTT